MQVPADIVVNATLAVMAKHVLTAKKADINFYHVCSSTSNPLVNEDMCKLFYQHFKSSVGYFQKDTIHHWCLFIQKIQFVSNNGVCLSRTQFIIGKKKTQLYKHDLLFIINRSTLMLIFTAKKNKHLSLYQFCNNANSISVLTSLSASCSQGLHFILRRNSWILCCTL